MYLLLNECNGIKFIYFILSCWNFATEVIFKGINNLPFLCVRKELIFTKTYLMVGRGPRKPAFLSALAQNRI